MRFANKIYKTGRRVRRTLRIMAAWMVCSVLEVLYAYYLLTSEGASPDVRNLLTSHLAQGAAGGLILGGTYVFLLHDRLRKLPFLSGFALVSGFIAASVGIAAFAGGTEALQGTIWTNTWRLMGQFIGWALLMGSTMLVLRLDDQFGNGALGFLIDRFRKPRQELRIFMFLDMRSSTSVAETIGDTLYFKLLNELYADITDPVLYSEGEIYQYVGDEISVSWRLERGLRNLRCIRCFFAIRDKLRKRGEHYRKAYGITPVFKAGFHYGRVTGGEVGLVKRQTIFSGDAVNTTAHIQAMCNGLGVDNLVSKELIDALALRSAPYIVKPVGSIPLKGKRMAMELYTLTPEAERQ